MFCHLQKNKIKGCSTLLIQGPFNIRDGRTFLSTSKKGGLTVEAALIVPFCTFFFAMLLYMIVFMLLYIRIQCSIYHMAASICQNAYILQAGEDIIGESLSDLTREERTIWNVVEGGIEKEWIKRQILSDCGFGEEKKADSLCMFSEWKIEKAEFNTDNGDGQIELSYQIQIPFLAGNVGKFKVKQQVCFRGWVGKDFSDGVEEGGELVYVAKNGEVYHTNPSCTYLVPSVKKYKIEGNNKEYTLNGKVYISCKYCSMAAYEEEGCIWIANYGTCFHKTSQCSAIRRTVFVKNKNTLKGMRECSKCADSH